MVTLAVACIWINLQASGCQLSMRKTTASAFAALCSICCAFVYPLGFLLLGVAPHFRINNSIYSFVQLSWHSTGENDFWMVDLGFLLLSSPFPLSASFSDTCKTGLWMGKCGGRGKAHHKHTLSILSQFQSFHGSRGYSIDSFGSCPGTALVRMVGLGFLLFSSSFLSKFPFQTAPKMNFGWVHVDEGAGRTTNTRLIPSIL